MKVKVILIVIILLLLLIGLLIGFLVFTGNNLSGETVNLSELNTSIWVTSDNKSLIRFEGERVKLSKETTEYYSVVESVENVIKLLDENGKEVHAILMGSQAMYLDWLNEIYYRTKKND